MQGPSLGFHVSPALIRLPGITMCALSNAKCVYYLSMLYVVLKHSPVFEFSTCHPVRNASPKDCVTAYATASLRPHRFSLLSLL